MTAPPKQQGAQQRRAKSVVAIVEDFDSIRWVLERLIGTLGYPVRSFSTAEGFLEAFLDSETSELSPWGCLITDLDLAKAAIARNSGPLMNGLDLVRRLRSLGYASASSESPLTLPVLAMSGDVSQAPRAIAMGANDFLRKPIDLGALRSALSLVMGPPTREH